MQKRGHYFIPNWYGSSISQDMMNLEFFENQYIIIEKIAEQNKKIYQDLIKAKDEVGAKINIIYGPESRMYKYWKSNSGKEIPRPPDIKYALDKQRERWEKDQKIQKEEKNTIKRSKEQWLLLQEAIQFLIKRDRVPGTDYEMERGIEVANQICFDELVNQKIKNLEAIEEYIEFNGQNCEDRPCEGWDGISRRCQCGNRRVSWSYEGDFRNMYIYGEAY